MQQRRGPIVLVPANLFAGTDVNVRQSFTASFDRVLDVEGNFERRIHYCRLLQTHCPVPGRR